MTQSAAELPTLMRESVVLTPEIVRILDRRTFPLKIEFVDCPDVETVARVIEEMVTQSGGPYLAASAGLVLAAREADRLAGAEARMAHLNSAAVRLIATRPTNNLIRNILTRMLAEAELHAEAEDFSVHIEALMRRLWDDRKQLSAKMGEYTASLIGDGESILTHCWGESGVIYTLAHLMQAGKKVSVVCTETRPYLQGSRLTAHSVAEMGIPVTVITDNMGACAMASGKVSRLLTAADRVTASGHVINKVGTLQLAIAARHFGLPYIAMVGRPDFTAKGPEDVEMEFRDPEETLHCLGHRTATPLAQGWYPAFDVTPPELVTNITTNYGIFAPDALKPEASA
jgi:methylthioribose-1-phosphate isomerase